MKRILITGANSGIGAQLAKQYARQGASLNLIARDKDRLEDIADQCIKMGAKKAAIRAIDIRNHAVMYDYIRSLYKKQRLDLVIACAGISAGTDGDGEDMEQVRDIFATNIDGVVNTIGPAMKYMIKRKKGHIVIISSIAGFRGLPTAPAYSASKVAVRAYGEGLRSYLKQFRVKVTVVMPGFVSTPMTAVNDFPMPFEMSAEKAASIIIKKLEKNPARIAFPWPLYFTMWLISCLPPAWGDFILSKLPSKK